MVFVGGSNEAGAWSNLKDIVSSGVYAALLNTPKGYWGTAHEGTFADYASVQEGDAVFFFSKRKIYGIGRIVNVGGACRFLNFPGASEPTIPTYEDVQDEMLRDEGPVSVDQRWLCTFAGDPAIFTSGVDIDDVLASDPQSFKALRAMQSVSFARMDDRETQALKDVILRRNAGWLLGGVLQGGAFDDDTSETHARIASRLTPSHILAVAPLLQACANGPLLQHEMALEAGLVTQLVEGDSWDYVNLWSVGLRHPSGAGLSIQTIVMGGQNGHLRLRVLGRI